ncbi:DUF6346 domain-containing protein [Paractinoplanes rishiriensis]|uniref:Uncharacterized protein n=1 Tax=Paractinoplanes rishiriensis TaxID=1050105 RepID=A0A919JTT6_9ACTN|nr:DUF6346 domain-containing protein [Actinoplanes rishiriensis]GIE93272.1 hypothetical protein Ari01nite_07370 [Actinoplanes rishiriensis]
MPVNPDEAARTIEVLPERPAVPRPAPTPEMRRRAWFNATLAAALLVGVSFLLVGTALTVGRFAGKNYQDARRTGTAAIERCSLRGPVTLNGFGYHDRCTVTATWETGETVRVTIDKPGFFDDGDRVGDRFEIGENPGGYSRPGTAERSWVRAAAWAVGLLGLLPLLAAGLYLRPILHVTRLG